MRVYLLSACLTIVLAACGRREQAPSDKEVLSVPVIRLEPTDTTLTQQYVADIQASKNVEIRAKAGGFIENILVDEGQEVKKGQLLFTINDAEFKNEYTKTRAGYNNAVAESKAAELELNRIKVLVDKKIISKSEYELGQARLQSAAAKVDEARAIEEKARVLLSYTKICAPFSGIIDRIPMKRGSLIGEGTLLTTISDLQKMYAYFSVSENEYLHYLRSEKGGTFNGENNIDLVLADGIPFPQKGKIETMETVIDSHTGSIAFRASFPNPDKLLKHGASGKVLLKTSMDSALIIPQKAVMEIQDKNFVFVVDRNNTVKMRSFVPGTKFNGFIVIRSGLAKNETIVYEGIQSIREGTTIKPKYIDPENLSTVSLRQ